MNNHQLEHYQQQQVAQQEPETTAQSEMLNEQNNFIEGKLNYLVESSYPSESYEQQLIATPEAPQND